MMYLVFSLLALAMAAPAFGAAPKKLLLVGQGPDGHPPQTHEYMAGVRIVEKLLKPVKDVECTVVKADGAWKEGPELIERADAVVLFVSEGAKWLQLEPTRIEALQKLAKRGGGIVVLHWAMGCKDAKYIEPFVALAGGCHGGPDRKRGVFDTDVELADAKHPVLSGIQPFTIKEEFYYALKLAKPAERIKPLLRATIDGKQEMVCWAFERPDDGRSFGFSGLHFHDHWRRPDYRRLVAQGVLWTLKLDIPEKGLPVEVAEEDLKLK
jgi:type 1 glutamine amidotransferase